MTELRGVGIGLGVAQGPVARMAEPSPAPSDAASTLAAAEETARVREAERGLIRTDGGNLIYDAACKLIADPARLAADLKSLTGVVEHGLFLDLTDLAVIGTDEGVETLNP